MIVIEGDLESTSIPYWNPLTLFGCWSNFSDRSRLSTGLSDVRTPKTMTSTAGCPNLQGRSPAPITTTTVSGVACRPCWPLWACPLLPVVKMTATTAPVEVLTRKTWMRGGLHRSRSHPNLPNLRWKRWEAGEIKKTSGSDLKIWISWTASFKMEDLRTGILKIEDFRTFFHWLSGQLGAACLTSWMARG